jgi:hypothetical protein
VLFFGSIERQDRKESLQGRPAHRSIRIDNDFNYPNCANGKLTQVNRSGCRIPREPKR